MALSPSNLPYKTEDLPRELKKYYISLSTTEIDSMLKDLGINKVEEIFNSIPKDVQFDKVPDIGNELEYYSLIEHVENISKKNKIKTSFIGDGLKSYKVPQIVSYVSSIRGLSTAYTPYQPERSQGTLMSLYLYASALSELTGFEAINASMYDRSTCLFEAMNTATKLVRGSDTVLVSESIYPGDLEVLKTLATGTQLKIITIPLNKTTGLTDLQKANDLVISLKGKLAGIAFPQVNSLGNLEDVNALTDLAYTHNIQSIAIIDPMLLSSKGLLSPSLFGSNQQGTHMIVGEGQHLCLAPNFGGPGLGIFGIRFNKDNQLSIRSTPGRYIGKAKDENGKDCLTMVLSTREQHIRREKATSNICSNQAFIATLAGAATLERGDEGINLAITKAQKLATTAALELVKFKGVKLAFETTAFFNEFVLELPMSAASLISNACKNADLHLGVDVSKRINVNKDNYLLLSFSDINTEEDIKKLIAFFSSVIKEKNTQSKNELTKIPEVLLKNTAVHLPKFNFEELKSFYTKLGEQNVSPDDTIYPLGSCTMKYNPFVNDYLASLPGFTDIHPQAPLEDAQGSLEILFNIQEMFKKITGLPHVTTQPVAGAHGELTALKLFQAYHKDNGDIEKRKNIIIPHSAHGTNPASAAMAGFNVIVVEASTDGLIDQKHLDELLEKHMGTIAGIMVTNPNTSGIFETYFKDVANKIHKAGGLVYMDGANMNAIASWVDLSKLGVDAVHNNLHKTWSISHGGGGPGDAIVAVSEKLKAYLPGVQVFSENGIYKLTTTEKSIGSLHRHFGNFAHKIRCYAYLKALGSAGVCQMSAIAVLSARYLFKKIKDTYPVLPANTENIERMHEFILTLPPELFLKIEKAGIAKANIIARVGKLFLDYGLHAPTVAFPEVFGLMVEPTESYNKKELYRFIEVLKNIFSLIQENPEILTTVPHFTPVNKVDEVSANKMIILGEKITKLPEVLPNKISPSTLQKMTIPNLNQEIIKAHKERIKGTK